MSEHQRRAICNDEERESREEKERRIESSWGAKWE